MPLEERSFNHLEDERLLSESDTASFKNGRTLTMTSTSTDRENVPTAVSSMLKTTTEVTDYGQFQPGRKTPRSMRHSQKKYAIPLNGSRSTDLLPLGAPRRTTPFEADGGPMFLNGYDSTKASSLTSLNQSHYARRGRTYSQASDSTSRSFSMTNQVAHTFQPGHRRVYAVPRSAGGGSPKSVRSQSSLVYPARLKRHGYRPNSPSINDYNGASYPMRRPSPEICPPGQGYGVWNASYRTGINASIPPRIESPSYFAGGKNSIYRRLPHSRSGTSTPISVTNGFEISLAATASVQPVQTLPIKAEYYDYSEGFDEGKWSREKLEDTNMSLGSSPSISIERTIHEDRPLSEISPNEGTRCEPPITDILFHGDSGSNSGRQTSSHNHVNDISGNNEERFIRETNKPQYQSQCTLDDLSDTESLWRKSRASKDQNETAIGSRELSNIFADRQASSVSPIQYLPDHDASGVSTGTSILFNNDDSLAEHRELLRSKHGSMKTSGPSSVCRNSLSSVELGKITSSTSSATPTPKGQTKSNFNTSLSRIPVQSGIGSENHRDQSFGLSSTSKSDSQFTETLSKPSWATAPETERLSTEDENSGMIRPKRMDQSTVLQPSRSGLLSRSASLRATLNRPVSLQTSRSRFSAFFSNDDSIADLARAITNIEYGENGEIVGVERLSARPSFKRSASPTLLRPVSEFKRAIPSSADDESTMGNTIVLVSHAPRSIRHTFSTSDIRRKPVGSDYELVNMSLGRSSSLMSHNPRHPRKCPPPDSASTLLVRDENTRPKSCFPRKPIESTLRSVTPPLPLITTQLPFSFVPITLSTMASASRQDQHQSPSYLKGPESDSTHKFKVKVRRSREVSTTSPPKISFVSDRRDPVQLHRTTSPSVSAMSTETHGQSTPQQPKFRLKVTSPALSTLGTDRPPKIEDLSIQPHQKTSFDLFRPGPPRTESPKLFASFGKRFGLGSSGEEKSRAGPSTSLVPPSLVSNPSEVRSFFSDDSSIILENGGSIRKRLSQMKIKLPSPRLGSGEDNWQSGKQHSAETSGVGDSSMGISDSTVGRSNMRVRARKAAEKIRTLLGWSAAKMKHASEKLKARGFRSLGSHHAYEGT